MDGVSGVPLTAIGTAVQAKGSTAEDRVSHPPTGKRPRHASGRLSRRCQRAVSIPLAMVRCPQSERVELAAAGTSQVGSSGQRH